MTGQPIIVFDVNETLLDLAGVQPVFDRIFSDPAAMRLWFAGLITYSEALTLAGVYVPFTDIGAAVLEMLAAARGITISAADGAALTDRFATMPPHPEVPAALRRLRDHGFRVSSRAATWLRRERRRVDAREQLRLAHGMLAELSVAACPTRNRHPAVHQRAYRPVPPAEGLRQARRHLAQPAGPGAAR